MKKTLLSIFLSAICLVGMSQKSQIDLPITWDDTATVDYTVIPFGGDSVFFPAADPSNASNIVLGVVKPSGSATQTWAGVVLGTDSLATAIPFSAGNTVMQVHIHAPASGIPVRLKVENESNGGIFVETEVNTTAAGWNVLTFDFASQVSGTPAINFSNVYDKIAIFPNFGTVPSANQTYYIDSVVFVGGGSSGPSKAMIDLPITWDDTANVDYSVIDFGGNVSSQAADPTNASNLVLKSDKGSSAQTWAGTTFGSALATAIPFSSGNTIIRALVYSPATGVPVRLKVEDQTDPTKTVETEVTTTVIGWDTLVFDMANQATGTSAINFAYTFDKMSIFYNFGTVPSSTETYYVDDVWFGAGSTGPSKAQIDLPIDWDDSTNVDYTVIDFGGNSSMLAADPTNATNTVLQSDKTAGAQTWGGTTLGNSLATAIPFATGMTTMQARVYSPAAGVVVRLKAEDQTNPGLSVETDASTTSVGWNILTFDFANNATGTAAINFATTYDKLSIFYNFGVSPTATETYYVDGVAFGQLSTGINETRVNPSFTVYPNPATDVVTIDASLLEDVNQIVVTNSIGQVVLQKNVSALDNKVDVTSFDNGVYFMVLSSDSGVKTAKFMVTK